MELSKQPNICVVRTLDYYINDTSLPTMLKHEITVAEQTGKRGYYLDKVHKMRLIHYTLNFLFVFFSIIRSEYYNKIR